MKQKNIFKKITTILIAIILIIPNLVFADNSQNTIEDSLTISIHKDENNLTPYTYMTGYPGLEVVRLIFDSLFTLDKDNNVIPWMVDEYSVNENYKEYTLKLKENLKWHDGKKLTSDDVKFSFEYALNQDSSRWRKIANQIEKIDVTNELNLKILLKQPNINFLREGLADFLIIPKHMYQDVSKATEVTEVIGSGMYKIKEYKTGQFYKLEATQNYPMGNIAVKNIFMPIMTDKSSIFQAIKAGQITASTVGLSPELLDTFKLDKDIKILSETGYSTTLLQFNNEVYPFNEVKFRQAITSAIDLDEIINKVMLGYADKGSPGFYHNGFKYANKDLKYVKDVNKANELLDELGLSNKNSEGIRLGKDNEPLELELLVYSGNPLRIRIAEIISSELETVGIRAKVASMEAGTVDELVWPGFDVKKGRNYHMTIWGWSAPTQLNPNSLMALACSNLDDGYLNIGGYKNPEFDKLAQVLKDTLDEEKREKILNDMQAVIANDMPFMTMFNPQVICAYNTTQYDGWVMQKGIGIINKFSFLGNEKIQQANETSKDNNSKNIFIMIVGGIAILAVVITLFRRGRKG